MWKNLIPIILGRRSHLLVGLFGCLAFGLVGCQSSGSTARTQADPDRTFTLTLRDRVASKKDPKKFINRVRQEVWQANETAVIVCDMWDRHHSPNAMRRVGELAPRMNQFLHEARRRGAIIIHAPSSCTQFYKDHPARKRVASVPRTATLPKNIMQWCRWGPTIEEREAFPIDHSDGGSDDDPKERQAWLAKLKAEGSKRPWRRQIDILEIDPKRDYITDQGSQNWWIQEHHGIKNVMIMGVHTNLCVIGRPFGLQQMVKNGRNTVLVRDMTDAMYNPKRRPFVDHFTGVELVVQHIERFIAPTITSGQVIGDQKIFRFKGDKRPVPASARLK